MIDQEKFQELIDWERKMLVAHGWYAHYVFPTKDDHEHSFQAHTHGVSEMFGHPDFQITLQLSDKIANNIFHTIVNNVKLGVKYVPGDYDGIIKGYKVRLVEATEGSRKLLRIIFPGENGVLDRCCMSENFAKQYE